ncbi:MAG: hypothetical protein OXP09_14845, partial [Gammaproteobacteria bacterium]|nr:hypothetical protein [Gammaproteobacteria bacterium]
SPNTAHSTAYNNAARAKSPSFECVMQTMLWKIRIATGDLSLAHPPPSVHFDYRQQRARQTLVGVTTPARSQ